MCICVYVNTGDSGDADINAADDTTYVHVYASGTGTYTDSSYFTLLYLLLL